MARPLGLEAHVVELLFLRVVENDVSRYIQFALDQALRRSKRALNNP